MITLLDPIKARLQAHSAFSGWALFTAAEEGDRKAVPRAAIGFSSARVSSVRTTVAQVEPSISITLVVKRGSGASAAIDAAMEASIGLLHNWYPGQQGGRSWEAVRLAQITDPDFDSEEGLVGLTLAFTTQALYTGQP